MKVSLIALLLLLSPGYASAEPWLVYTHSLGEQGVIIDGTLRGKEHGGKRAFYLELVHALLAELGSPTPISEVPLARGLKLVTEQPHVVLFNLSRTPEREGLVHWVGPTLQETDYLYESSDAPTGIRSLNDARDLPVCILNGSAHDELLGKQGFTQLKRHNSYSGCFRMLAAGRVQLVASADGGLQQKLAEAQVDPTRIRATPVVLGHDRGFIALSKDTSPNDVARWQAALDKVRGNGQYQALYQRYGQ
ncbi:ABC transporter substrate-binding protein [Pseudomonas sp. J452]|uniref:substrate-binding periplasmic protein n=1 Tax=Pseudomonas sp. J452 TaxID=2898441 RepID=UPI0021AE0EFF|nr:ABC transporter substrate-binding protein [Pseudomonas sp. J452]UUY08329.1 ABC transporter substrate-binding protein [Pseudomonas sp. J452]